MLAWAVSSPQLARITLSIQEKVLECEPGCTALCLANLQSALPQAEGSSRTVTSAGAWNRPGTAANRLSPEPPCHRWGSRFPSEAGG